uniref:RNA-directed DNA polymerase, eukaryota n=1 Tax=Tanacetum cinerariifolium TaxID=118510 RepID=A0A6L2JU92_TANCI|nr:RNA-directed DNA polymerase, eukaryota [Tanacetum cinerariifolium]
MLLSNKGFSHIKVVYLGGLYVMIELPTAKSKSKFLNHVGVASWFNALSDVQPDFIPREKFKIIVKGKIFVVRAKELFVWSPTFTEVPETTYCSDDDSNKGAGVNLLGKNVQPDLQEESDHEAVSETFFGENVEEFGNATDQLQYPIDKEASYDPFNIYDILNKRNKDAGNVEQNEDGNVGTDSSVLFPPGFTPEKAKPKEAAQEGTNDHVISCSHDKSAGSSLRIMENVQNIKVHTSTVIQGSGCKHKTGGSILVVLDEMIKVGQTMGFTMDRCANDLEKIIGSQGVHEVF